MSNVFTAAGLTGASLVVGAIIAPIATRRRFVITSTFIGATSGVVAGLVDSSMRLRGYSENRDDVAHWGTWPENKSEWGY
eukprot:CAMPEP_0196769490 /NCGR_PEP_ID=MMETSP1104-20130614/577_1 /TAXON_ID=33652 /ORGANISM="Cafeteria sp., Strain Caron Lab Isolate" /LENGTH=79 /DNA_ID=CAMNT_0042139585 /DNA_START=80 /DNA_END=319 /DNA_ORIENTATION=+